MPRRPRARRRGARRGLPPPPPSPGSGPGPDGAAQRLRRSRAEAAPGARAPRAAAEHIAAELRRIALIGSVCGGLLVVIAVADRLR